uniref:Carbamoyl phosphate synthase small chain n=1 Tax=Thaumatella adunca TaxID=2006976 RepID=A0A1Z1MND2_9FLOR|nr:carbamoyl phosphate synthase small subunit [Thaumatella adunca]ARW67352.1 carbamoyl phosphate synthase small subunit [Thaumatella adunca]
MSNTLFPAVLHLRDGTSYRGWSFFPLLSYSGEIVFNTGMTGYQEIFSDPSYSGQMVIFTYPEIGNTGLNRQDNESNFIHIKAIVAKNISSISSNWRSTISLKDYILLKNIPHIFGLDTRALTKHLRLFGVMSAFLSNNNINVSINNIEFKVLDNLDLVRKLTTKKNYTFNQEAYLNLTKSLSVNFLSFNYINAEKVYKIVVIDFGLKFNILRKLIFLGCQLYVVPATCNYQTILKYKPDGILLSNGPGNPLSSLYSINVVKKLVNFANLPIFGICMGHQILNLAFGGKTFKLKFGHRGLNHPSGCNNYSEITSQNHGFSVDKNYLLNTQLRQVFSVKYLNLNDFTVSGTIHKNNPFFSVQYHPEASPGPHDSEYLFKIFIKLISFIQSKK